MYVMLQLTKRELTHTNVFWSVGVRFRLEEVQFS